MYCVMSVLNVNVLYLNEVYICLPLVSAVLYLNEVYICLPLVSAVLHVDEVYLFAINGIC